MRNNQPVTGIEFVLPDNTFIYSRTDLKGRITAANEAFASISGFTPDEMIGEPHNLIRHPDMPEAAFADMWRALKAGLPWKGVVKNRRKDGGFYWVVANVSPVRENGQIVGFQSVRTRPSPAQIAAAENAYRRLREGDRSIRVEQGRVVRNRAAFVLTWLAHATQTSGFALVAGLLALLQILTQCFAGALPPLALYASAGIVLIWALYLLCVHLPASHAQLKRIDSFLAQSLSAGDLTMTLANERADILGRIATQIDTQISALRATLHVMADATREVAETAQQLNGQVETLAGAAEIQNEATASAAAGVEQMSASIDEVAQHAQSTHSLAEEAGRMADEGASLSQKASETIRLLATSVGLSSGMVEQLGKRSDEIGAVAATIKEIADQTNLLALNAAIEAARAGEQGRGFAVVADEVRKLAERTTLATQEIDQMIGAIRIDTEQAVDSMRESVRQVDSSVELVHEAHSALAGISGHMRTTTEQMATISHSSREQSVAMNLVAGNIEQIAGQASETVAVAHTTETCAHTLGDNVQRMQKAVTQYRC